MSTSLKQAIEAAKARVSAAFDAVEAKGGTKPSIANLAALPSAIESIPSGGGVHLYKSNGEEIPQSLHHIYSIRYDAITMIDDENEMIAQEQAFSFMSSLKEAHFTKLISLQQREALGTAGNLWFFSGTRIRYIYMPKLMYVRGDRFFENMDNLIAWHMPLWYGTKTIGSGYYMNNINRLAYSAVLPNLIEFEVGKNFEQSTSLSVWSATNALLADSTSLLTQKDIEDGFTSNLQKFLYNMRTLIAVNLNPNITATITFSAGVKAAILADEETMAAFPPSWTIA